MSRTYNRDEAMKFIRLNLLNYDFDDLVNEVKEKFNYSHYYAVTLCNSGGMTLRQKLEMQEEARINRIEQKRLEQLNSRPKLIILY